LAIGGMIRFIVPFYMLVTAVMAATFLIIVVHFGFGFARSTIRIDALAGIIFAGAAFAGSSLLNRKK
jgi:hypothetical protein